MAKQETIHIKTGETHEISLKGNATSGYQWEALPVDGKVISIKKSFAEKKGGKMLMGSNADEVFSITGLKKGKTQLHLQQTRSWEKEAAPANEITYEIVVE